MREYPRATLVPPVDWAQDPHRDRSWVHYLHGLTWLDQLLSSYVRFGDEGALARARDLLLDYVHRNPRGEPSTPPMAWNDKGAGDRAELLGYITRAAACEGMLSDPQAWLLIVSMRDHAAFLSLPENHPVHNHALFVDLGLARLGRYASFLREGDTWVDRARRTFTATLLARLNQREGIWLEHSTTYQFAVLRLVEQFARVAGGERLGGLAAVMREAAGWLVTPDNRMAPIGDTNERAAIPTWARAEAADDSGLRVMRRSGYAAVKKKGGYLLVGASFHSTVHKHSDDLGFHLYDGGRDIVSDSGIFSYNLDKWRDFSRSAAAHSVLTVNGSEFPTLDPKNVYGSGIRAGGRGDGWYAIEGRNPLVRSQGVRHRRVFLYKPGRALLVVDRVRSKGRHRYRRSFQIASGLEVEPGKRAGLALRATGFSGRLRDSGRRSRRAIVAGRYTPPAGWSFPSKRRRVARPTVHYRSRARNANYLAAFGLRGPVRARVLDTGKRSLAVAVRGGGVKPAKLHVTRRKHHLKVKRSSLGVRGRQAK